MKISAALAEQAVNQINAELIPDDHPAVPQLTRVFGDHTFFIDAEGLSIVEPAEVPEPGMEACELVKVARWSDDGRTTLAPHPPQPTAVVVVLKPH